MSGFLYGQALQWKLDLRNKGILLTCYAMPLVFFCFMGGVFTSINPEAYKTLVASMTVFGVSVGGLMGFPSGLVQAYTPDRKKAYTAGHIPLWTAAVHPFLSCFLHLFLVSILLMLLGKPLFHAAAPANYGSYFLSLTLLLLVTLSLGTLLGLWIRKSEQLTVVSMLIFLPSTMLTGIMFPAEMLPQAIHYLAYLFPAYWGNRMMCAASFDWTGCAVLCGMLLALWAACAWRLHRLRRE